MCDYFGFRVPTIGARYHQRVNGTVADPRAELQWFSKAQAFDLSTVERELPQLSPMHGQPD